MFRHLITSQGLPAEGDEKYTSDGSYTFTVPAGVTSISAVLIGGGGGSSANYFGGTVEGGAGGTLVYATLLVTPGESLSVVVGDGGDAGAYNLSGFRGQNGESTTISRGGTLLLRAPGGKGGVSSTSTDSVFIDADALSSGSNAGGAGGLGSDNREGNGGGGAGGYSGVGGAGGDYQQDSGQDGAGGAGGGGASGTMGGFLNGVSGEGAYGGGTAIFGEGANGAGGDERGDNGGVGSTQSVPSGSVGYGSGAPSRAGARYLNPDAGYSGLAGDHGAVRIVYPGQSRYYPSTNLT